MEIHPLLEKQPFACKTIYSVASVFIDYLNIDDLI